LVKLSTRGAAKRLGIGHETLANYVRSGKIPAPEAVQHGQRTVHTWSDEHIELVRKLLPKIKNGRKTRYQKQKGEIQKPQAKRLVPHKKKNPAS